MTAERCHNALQPEEKTMLPNVLRPIARPRQEEQVQSLLLYSSLSTWVRLAGCLRNVCLIL
jgi:hypothetical protein